MLATRVPRHATPRRPMIRSTPSGSDASGVTIGVAIGMAVATFILGFLPLSRLR